MTYYVSSSVDCADDGSLRRAFIYGSDDIEVELTQDINLVVAQPFTFFNSPKSFKINTNGFECVTTGAGFVFQNMEYVEVSGVTFYNFTGDGIQLNNVAEYKIRNCDFHGHISTSDEAISSVKGAASIRGEICWNFFNEVNKGILCGTGDSPDAEIDKKQRVFIHHNYFKDFERRAPYCREGIYCIYNNVFENWKYRGDQTFCIWAEDNAKAIVVSNSFEQPKYNMFDGFPKRQMSWFTKRPWCMDQGFVARLGAVGYTADNTKNQDYIRIDGNSLVNTADFPEYERYSIDMVNKVKTICSAL